jgi:S-adenosylmethionine hydrolase
MTASKTREEFEAWYASTTFFGRDAVWAAYQAARRTTLEQVAKVLEARIMGDNNREDQEAKRCVAAIRALGDEGMKP